MCGLNYDRMIISMLEAQEQSCQRDETVYPQQQLLQQNIINYLLSYH